MLRPLQYFLIALVLITLPACGIIKPSWLREKERTVVQKNTKPGEITPEDFNGPLGGTFDAAGRWVPHKQAIEWTYRLPDISAGMLGDIRARTISPSLSIELVEVDTHIPYVGTIKCDFGVGNNLGYVYVGKLFTSIFEISAGGWVGWHVKNEKVSYGVGLTIIKF